MGMIPAAKPLIGDAPGEKEPSVTGPGDKESLAEDVSHDLAIGKPYIHAVGPAAFGQLTEKADEQAKLFATRLSKRAKHLRRWPSRRRRAGARCLPL